MNMHRGAPGNVRLLRARDLLPPPEGCEVREANRRAVASARYRATGGQTQIGPRRNARRIAPGFRWGFATGALWMGGTWAITSWVW